MAGGGCPSAPARLLLAGRADPNWRPTDAPAVAGGTSAALQAPSSPCGLGKSGGGARKGLLAGASAAWLFALATGCGARGLHVADRSKRRGCSKGARARDRREGGRGSRGLPGTSEGDSPRPPTARLTPAKGSGGREARRVWRDRWTRAFKPAPLLRTSPPRPEVPVPNPREPLAPYRQLVAEAPCGNPRVLLPLAPGSSLPGWPQS